MEEQEEKNELEKYYKTVYFYMKRALIIYAIVSAIIIVAGQMRWFFGFTFGSAGALLIFRLHSITTRQLPNKKNPLLFMRFHYIIRLLILAAFVLIAIKRPFLNVYFTIGGLFVVKIAIYLFREK